MTSRRAKALELSDELLTDFELSTLPAAALVRKVSRLARLIEDRDAMEWLGYELQGYRDPETGKMARGSSAAAKRSGRAVFDEEHQDTRYLTQSIGNIQASVDAARANLSAAADAPVSVSSANPSQYVSAPMGNLAERARLHQIITRDQGLLDEILGSIYSYVSEKELELRFGAVSETAFEQVRKVVDGKISELVPEAAAKLAAAFENASSSNSENWANAASTCRRLIKEVADALRPPGPDVDGRKMGPDQYINRLVDWIINVSVAGDTTKAVVARDLEYLGNRLDALAGAGHKGAHDEVTRYEASRYIAGTYLLIGDILELHAESPSEEGDGEGVD